MDSQLNHNVAHSGKCCVYTNRMLSKNFRIYEKKLARHRAYLVNEGKSWILQWGKTLKKIEIDFLGQKIYQYCSRVYQKMRNLRLYAAPL